MILTRSAWKVFEEIPNNEHSHMHYSPTALAKAVIPVGIDHVIKWFPEFDQSINEPFDNLNVSIRFARSRDHQQFAPQPVRKVNRRRSLVAIRVHFACPHVNLLKPRVVEMWLRLRDYRNTHVILVGLAEHGVECV